MKTQKNFDLEGKKICIIDIDGTLLEEFKQIFNRIMSQLFGNNIIVKFVNKIFNWVNDLDIISNSMLMFKLVLLFYSIISFSSFRDNCAIYEKSYFKFAFRSIEKAYYNYVLEFEKMGYTVLCISHNIYTHHFDIMNGKIFTPTNKRKFLPQNFKDLDVKFVIGNNYMDDIISGKKLNKEYSKKMKYHSIVIYVGCSKIVRKIVDKDIKCFLSMEEVLKYVKDVT